MNINSISARRFVALVAAGLIVALPAAKATVTVATADQDFMLAAAQGGMTEVKLGASHGLTETHKDQLNGDLLAFLKT